MKKLKGRGHPRFYQLLSEMADTHSRKNFNYAEDGNPLSNLKMSESFGIPAHIGTWVRISDKYSRVCQLLKGKPDLVDESLKDTLLDMAIYCVLEIVLLEDRKKK